MQDLILDKFGYMYYLYGEAEYLLLFFCVFCFFLLPKGFLFCLFFPIRSSWHILNPFFNPLFLCSLNFLLFALLISVLQRIPVAQGKRGRQGVLVCPGKLATTSVLNNDFSN